jgi:Host cell surface-exposed lipoprotein
VYAVNHVNGDWKQAVLSAKGYLSMGGGFSRSRLIEQLSSKYGEQFTLAQATQAVNHVGL